MSKATTFFMRLIPIVMQIVGFIGMIVAALYSASMIIGAGIGSPSGRPDDAYYVTAYWIIGIPAFVFLGGWIWVVCGFLAAPVKKGISKSQDATHE